MDATSGGMLVVHWNRSNDNRMQIKPAPHGEEWILIADIRTGGWDLTRTSLGLTNNRIAGYYWSTDRNWVEHGQEVMKFPTQAAAEKYLTTHRKRIEEADIQP